MSKSVPKMFRSANKSSKNTKRDSGSSNQNDKGKEKASGSLNGPSQSNGKANILVLGTSGAGKSTLINTVIGKKVAMTGSGKHVTEKMCSYESENLNFRLIDSRPKNTRNLCKGHRRINNHHGTES